MNITIGVYLFHLNKVIIKKPFEIKRETEKCYYIEHGRYLKADIGTPIIKSATQYPYVEVVMVDANEKALRKKLGEWFVGKACEICNIKM